MTEAQIWQTIEDYGRAAARGKAAGFDAVQIHAAHGFLIAGFLSPLTNRRNDAWGGDATRRSRFLVEVSRAVREVVGDDYPVLCKIVVDDFVPFCASSSDRRTGSGMAARLCSAINFVSSSSSRRSRRSMWYALGSPI